jgi:hypothetical protein
MPTFSCFYPCYPPNYGLIQLLPRDPVATGKQAGLRESLPLLAVRRRNVLNANELRGSRVRLRPTRLLGWIPVEEEFVALPEESPLCPICGKRAAMLSDSEDSEVLEIDVRAHRRRIRRRRYRAACDCDSASRTLTAPPLSKLIPKGSS